MPGTNPTALQPTVVPSTTAHSHQIKDFVESQSASIVSSMPMNKTKVDANMVGTYGRVWDARNKKEKVIIITTAASGRPPPARAKNRVFE